VEANRRAKLVYGYTAAELVGMPAAKLIPEEAKPSALTILQQVQ
jgi:PAS domain S-box-containing protein